jgi:hypothetical protein
LLRGLAWVRDVRLRMREEGPILYGEAFLIACNTEDMLPRRWQPTAVQGFHWRIKDFLLAVVDELPD